ncbi:3984_t:CDS:2, partial [Scutellospora calospora]
MCFSTAKWKREEVRDHKFAFIDVDSFNDKKLCSIKRIQYAFIFLVILKTVLVYIADVWTAVILLIFNRWSSTVNPAIPIYISKWIYVGCIFASFILLVLEARKARSVMKSDDISFAFTNLIAYKCYTFGWKRLVFAEMPRQAINAFTLYSFIPLNTAKKYLDITYYSDDMSQRIVVGLMAFSLIIFIFSALRILFAAILYVPLICMIRGNLKEYCCHKIDKSELLKRRRKKHLESVKKDKKKNGTFIEPKLPNVDDSPLPPYVKSSTLPFLPDRIQTNSPEPLIGPPPYGSKAATPNYGSKAATPNYGSRAATLNYGSSVATPNYGQVSQYHPYHAETVDYPQQPYSKHRPPPSPQINSFPMNQNNFGSVSEPILTFRQNQCDPIIAPQPVLPDMGNQPQPYHNNRRPSQPNAFPINQHNVILPEYSYNNLHSASEPVPIFRQNQHDQIIARQNQYDPQQVVSDIGNLQQPYDNNLQHLYDNNGPSQSGSFPINKSNIPA